MEYVERIARRTTFVDDLIVFAILITVHNSYGRWRKTWVNHVMVHRPQPPGPPMTSRGKTADS